ncbi:hypothetical protein [Salinibacterium sp. ZJ77]|uniref:hypothetical protein n=1 Tax=Salinibacterium sp. ZJ77 TaxID=2708337 RepID=UPI0014218270|nr:hypothetical protein [Salinibacterium sp. ZJ77]
MPYTAERPGPRETSDELRARIPGWGSDIDPANRPSFPRERPEHTGAHWRMPEHQGEDASRERSIEHLQLTPVYGTAQPLHGVSGVVRRFAYDHYSEGKAAHWLLLMLGDRIDAAGAHAQSMFTTRPDNPITQTGVLAEGELGGIRSRFGRGRYDVRHIWLDPVIVAAPWLITGAATAVVLRMLLKKKR